MVAPSFETRMLVVLMRSALAGGRALGIAGRNVRRVILCPKGQWNTTDQSMELRAQALTASAPGLGITIVPLPVHNPEEIDAALVRLTKIPADAVIVVTDPMVVRKQRATIDFLTAHRLPSMYEYPGAAKNGALLSYGPNFADLAPIAADYVDRILKGAKAADLPIQAPTRLYLLINAKTASDLGITIPPALMLRAEEVIE